MSFAWIRSRQLPLADQWDDSTLTLSALQLIIQVTERLPRGLISSSIVSRLAGYYDRIALTDRRAFLAAPDSLGRPRLRLFLLIPSISFLADQFFGWLNIAPRSVSCDLMSQSERLRAGDDREIDRYRTSAADPLLHRKHTADAPTLIS
jgi:hypothetical protein